MCAMLEPHFGLKMPPDEGYIANLLAAVTIAAKSVRVACALLRMGESFEFPARGASGRPRNPLTDQRSRSPAAWGGR